MKGTNFLQVWHDSTFTLDEVQGVDGELILRCEKDRTNNKRGDRRRSEESLRSGVIK